MLKNDNINSIFTSGYWVTAAAEIHKVRSLVFAGLTIAMGIVLSLIYIPVGMNLRISAAFLALALGSMIFGPIVGLFAGFAYDIIGFMIFPSNVFFPGYTLSTMLEFFIYGLFLYRRQISILRIFIMKFLVDFIIHVCLGSLWSEMLYGKGYYYFFVNGIVKNIIMLPIEVIMFVTLLQIFMNIFVHEGLMPKQKGKYIPII